MINHNAEGEKKEEMIDFKKNKETGKKKRFCIR